MNNTLLIKLSRQKLYNFNSTFLSTWSTLTTAFNARPTNKNGSSDNRPKVGLFDVPELQSPEGFYILKRQCIDDCNSLIKEAISKNRTRPMVEMFDELSDTLCKVADLAEFIRIAHPSNLYREAAEMACGTISGIVEKLNTNRELYTTLQNVVEHGDIMPTNAIDNHVARLFLFDFELSGIHLPEKERNEVVALNDDILQFGQQFLTGCAVPRTVKKGVLPTSITDLFSSDDDDSILVSGLNVDSTDSVAREMAYRIFLHPDDHQDYLLNKLLDARHKLARICGFPTYAHRALMGSTAETPDTVMKFLNHLADGLESRVENDFRVMSAMKRTDGVDPKRLAPWDIPYYTQRVKKEWFEVASSEFSPYFSLGTCMEGLNLLLSQLYGIRLISCEMNPGESWVPDIYKLAVTHENEGLLGYIYCDFYERTGKPNQDCHFTIRGGRTLPNGAYQQPVVVLMLSLPQPRWHSPSLLTPSMLDNLFHEMGHAMHSMLARTQYQHVTGTRCATDFAEVPSVLMEYFANDPRVLGTFARHFQTKEPIPEDMLHRLCASKHMFMANEMQMQVFYAALDQLYHGDLPLRGTTTEVLAAVQSRYCSLPYVPNTAWQLRFGHLVGYGAKYYSYLVSRSLASWIWQSYFNEDPFSRTQGERYRTDCLAHGGGKPPRQLVADFLQRQPTPDLLASSLLKEIDDKRYQIESITNVYKLL